mmetsp:Transcript_61305/g.109004  ORF Transcript_61305/g.109004 Transcript_61305/m.109004 type:complete len:219 (-) Transcript_61305:1744-2400(-)
MSADEEEHRIHRAPAHVRLRVASPLLVPLHVCNGASMDAVVDCVHLASVCVAAAADLLFQHARDANQTVCGTTTRSLNFLDARMSLVHVSVATTLGRVHGKNHLPPFLFELADCWPCQPVMTMDDAEAAPVGLVLLECPHEGAAHVADILNHAGGSVIVDLVVVHAQNLMVHCRPLSSGEDVDLMPSAMQRGRELGHMWCNAAYSNCVQGFPGQHGDL